MNKIWVREKISRRQIVIYSLAGILLALIVWMALTTGARPEQRIISRNVLPNPVDVVLAFPSLIAGTASGETGFNWSKSLLFAIWVSLRRELVSFLIVILTGVPLGILMSVSNRFRAFFYPLLIVGSFIPIAALIPLTQALFGIGEEQKIIFLALGMFFVLLGLVIKEMDEVDQIYLETAYTLGFSQIQTVFMVNFPAALPRIWKHFAAIFGIGWGYIIFAEMVNSGGGGDETNGIGWLFIARQRRMKVADMYAIFFVIIFFAFLFSWLFKTAGKLIFRHERSNM
jgi:NitT/TauT family transport system permease protein